AVAQVAPVVVDRLLELRELLVGARDVEPEIGARNELRGERERLDGLAVAVRREVLDARHEVLAGLARGLEVLGARPLDRRLVGRRVLRPCGGRDEGERDHARGEAAHELESTAERRPRSTQARATSPAMLPDRWSDVLRQDHAWAARGEHPVA